MRRDEDEDGRKGMAMGMVMAMAMGLTMAMAMGTLGETAVRVTGRIKHA